MDAILGMHRDRDISWSYNEMLDLTSDEVRSVGIFHHRVRQNYITAAAMAVRWELDRGIEGAMAP